MDVRSMLISILFCKRTYAAVVVVRHIGGYCWMCLECLVLVEFCSGSFKNTLVRERLYNSVKVKGKWNGRIFM